MEHRVTALDTQHEQSRQTLALEQNALVSHPDREEELESFIEFAGRARTICLLEHRLGIELLLNWYLWRRLFQCAGGRTFL